MIDLCAVCVGAVYETHTLTRITCSTDLAELGDVRTVTPDLARRLVEGEVRIWTPHGDLPMLAVTTVNGSRLCGYCATQEQYPHSRTWRR